MFPESNDDQQKAIGSADYVRSNLMLLNLSAELDFNLLKRPFASWSCGSYWNDFNQIRDDSWKTQVLVFGVHLHASLLLLMFFPFLPFSANPFLKQTTISAREQIICLLYVI